LSEVDEVAQITQLFLPTHPPFPWIYFTPSFPTPLPLLFLDHQGGGEQGVVVSP